MRLEEALECIERGEKITHRDWYRTEYVQMLDFVLTFVREWKGLSSDYFNITTEFLEKYDDSWEYDEDYEGCWEIYTGKYIPDEKTKNFYYAFNRLYYEDMGGIEELSSLGKFLEKHDINNNLMMELEDLLDLLERDYDFKEGK